MICTYASSRNDTLGNGHRGGPFASSSYRANLSKLSPFLGSGLSFECCNHQIEVPLFRMVRKSHLFRRIILQPTKWTQQPRCARHKDGEGPNQTNCSNHSAHAQFSSYLRAFDHTSCRTALAAFGKSTGCGGGPGEDIECAAVLAWVVFRVHIAATLSPCTPPPLAAPRRSFTLSCSALTSSFWRPTSANWGWTSAR